MDSSLTYSLPDILSDNGFNYERISDEEKSKLWAKINWNFMSNKTNVIYKIRFEEALELVKTRKVYLNSGSAYIMASEMVSVICNKFRSDLSHSLAVSLVQSKPIRVRLKAKFQMFYHLF